MSRKVHLIQQLFAVIFGTSALLMPDKILSQVLSSDTAENSNCVLIALYSNASNSWYSQDVMRNRHKHAGQSERPACECGYAELCTPSKRGRRNKQCLHKQEREYDLRTAARNKVSNQNE